LGASLALGWVSATIAILFIGLAMACGLLFSFGTLMIEERAFQRYPSWRCLARLALAAFIENFGYRQFNTCVRARAFWTLLRKNAGWGEMARIGYTVEPPVTAVATGPVPVPGRAVADVH